MNWPGIARPWFSDFLALAKPTKLSRAEFVAKYLPKYAHGYTARTGILMRGNRVVDTGSGWKGVVTKREKRIDEAFSAYLADYAACEASGHWPEAPVGNPTP